MRFFPSRRCGVLEVSHKNLRATVERVDDHLAVHRPGDFRAPILQIGGNRRDLPRFVVADGLGRREKIRHRAVINFRLPLDATGEKLLARRLKFAAKLTDEHERFGSG